MRPSLPRDYWQSMAVGGRGINVFNGIAIGKLFLLQEKFYLRAKKKMGELERLVEKKDRWWVSWGCSGVINMWNCQNTLSFLKDKCLKL